MKTLPRLRQRIAAYLGRLLATGLLVYVAGIGPLMATTVTVDQSPLIIQQTLPPNVVLMFDDSGSMNSGYMPDIGYISDTSDQGSRNSAINGAYYNDAVTYTPPPKADGTSYPNSPALNSAYQDGFTDTGTLVDVRSQYITTYDGQSPVPYATTPASSVASQASICPSGYTKYYSNYYNRYRCSNNSVTQYIEVSCPSDLSLDPTDSSNNTCDLSLFTYTTGATGSYVNHYIGMTGDCAKLTSTTDQGNCEDSAAKQQNVANWFSYYRKRILLAKSGLMSAFSGVSATFRVGFGSINGNNNNQLPSPTWTSSNGGQTIAEVAPFGDGSSGTQKANFWNWVSTESPNNSTPLRYALDSVGSYYQQDQPWYGMSSDPKYTAADASKQLACRQSYTILTTDGFWNSDFSGIGDVDGTAGSNITGPNSQSYTYAPTAPYADGVQTTSTSTVSAKCASKYSLKAPDAGHTTYYCYRSKNGSVTDPYCSSGYTQSTDLGSCSKTTTTGVSYSNTLADVAMKYWMTDLKTGIANEVPTNGADPAFWQHMTTFTLGMGFTPTDGAGTTLDTARMAQIFAWADGDNSKAISGFSWPKPASNSINNIADLAHAAVDGHGGFYSAKDPTTFANGIKDALKRAAERVGTGASLAANSTQLQTGTVAYQANYWTEKWKGDLKALTVDSTTGTIAGSPTWTASSMLPTAASRNIKTYNPSAASGSQFVDFKLGASNALPSLSTAENTALSSVMGTATPEADLINYLRGDDSNNAADGYRNRETPIGDIVNSQPVYAGAPDPNQFYTESFTGSSSFATYAAAQKSRAGTVYVAANDGMLHGFDATSGAENFAYLPGAVITAGVSALASPNYGDTVAHGFFNDGELTVADAYIGTTPAWKTILVGTTGRGVAKAVYALDITDPTDIKFLWERSAGDGLTNSNYIGQMVGKPVIAQTANGTWSVLIGNGYNSEAGKAALLQFDLATGTLHVHATTDTTGLAAPAVWMDPSGNGISTVAYAGDASGNVWSFTLNDSTGSAATATPDSAGSTIFVAKDSSGNRQPITAGLLIGKDPATGNTWVFFGTGRYLTTSDLSITSTQTWYGLIVQSSTSGLAVTSSKTRSANLAQRSIAQEAGNARALTPLSTASSISGKSGWYIDLTSPVSGAEGERMVTPNQFQGSLLLGTTRIPKASDPCSPSGEGWIMAINPFTGTNPSAPFFDVNGDGKVDASDTANGQPAGGIGFVSLPNNPIFVGNAMLTSFDNGTTSSTQTSGSGGSMQRVSWRELIAH